MRSLLFILDDANDPHSPKECFVYVHDHLFIYAPPGLLGPNINSQIQNKSAVIKANFPYSPVFFQIEAV